MKKIMLLAAAVTLTFAGCASAKNKPNTNTSNQAAAQSAARSSLFTTSKALDPEKVSCTKERDVRVLDVVKKGPGCALDYQKYGKTSTVASSSHGLKHCIHSQKKIRMKLERSGFSCA